MAFIDTYKSDDTAVAFTCTRKLEELRDSLEKKGNEVTELIHIYENKLKQKRLKPELKEEYEKTLKVLKAHLEKLKVQYYEDSAKIHSQYPLKHTYSKTGLKINTEYITSINPDKNNMKYSEVMTTLREKYFVETAEVCPAMGTARISITPNSYPYVYSSLQEDADKKDKEE